jgi:hypothetical protein
VNLVLLICSLHFFLLTVIIMPPAPSTIASFFSSSQNSHTTASTKDDADLRRAIELSEKEARLASLSEEELLQQALDANLAEASSHPVKRLRSESPDKANKVTPKDQKRSKIEEETRSVPDIKEDEEVEESELAFTGKSFNDQEETINRFNGSLDLLYCKGWIRKPERQQLRDWMLTELTWHRVSDSIL